MAQMHTVSKSSRRISASGPWRASCSSHQRNTKVLSRTNNKADSPEYCSFNRFHHGKHQCGLQICLFLIRSFEKDNISF